MKLITQFLFVVFSAAIAWSQEADWEKEWKQLVIAGQKEGKVVVMGSADPVLRKELPARFKARFGVALEYLGGRGADNFSRVMMERRAGMLTADAVMSGVSNAADYYKEKALAPLLPALLLPEVLDGSKWKKGKLWFIDPDEKYILRLYNYVASGLLYLNTRHAKPEEFRSIKDLLQPKWKGKISIFDPTVASGPGVTDTIHFYSRFGEDFLRKLLIDQKPVFSRDKRQIADWLGHGIYPVSISAETEFVVTMKKEGLPVDVIPIPDDPGYVNAGNGHLALFNKAAHPNAARVFVNWLASKEGMEILGRARQKPTTRGDIDESYALHWEVPRPGVSYLDAHGWQFTLSTREELHKKVLEILKAR